METKDEKFIYDLLEMVRKELKFATEQRDLCYDSSNRVINRENANYYFGQQIAYEHIEIEIKNYISERK